MANNPYSLVHTGGTANPAEYNNLSFKTYDERGHITPNFEFSEGQRPAGEFMPAPYLAAVRFNKYFEEYFVLSGGKVVALDSNGYVVPAGLKKQMASYIAAFDGGGGAGGTGLADADTLVTNNPNDFTVYAQADIDRGALDAAGNAVVLGDAVVKGLLDLTGNSAVIVTNVSCPVGVSMYNYWAHPGGNGENPVDFNKYNFNLQNKVVFLCDYQIELPTVEDDATYAAAPFAGMGAMVGGAGTILPGMFVTYDNQSNFVLSADDAGYGHGTTTPTAEVLGQVLSTDTRLVRDLLDRVRTRYNNFGELEKMPGTATEGKSDTLTYSGGYGLVRINLQLR
jgi:hypothetical protein